MTEHDELRKLAEHASRGPWGLYTPNPRNSLGFNVVFSEFFRNDPLARSEEVAEGLSPNDARYVAAADPQTVLGLLDEIDRLRERQESADLVNEGIRQKNRAIEAERERDALRAKVERVRAIHHPVPTTYGDRECGECGYGADWPCPTINALRGSDE